MWTVTEVADSCKQLQRLQKKVSIQALKFGVAENVKTVAGTNFNSNIIQYILLMTEIGAQILVIYNITWSCFHNGIQLAR